MKQIILSIFIFFCLPFVSYAQSYLDTSFNHTGIIKDAGGVTNSITIQNGKILIYGGYYDFSTGTGIDLFRLNPDGSFDNSFGNNGSFNISSPYTYIKSACLIGDNIFLVGSVDTSGSDDFCIIKLDVNGALDNSFGNGGYVTTGLAHYWHSMWMDHTRDVPSSIAQQSNGNIIVFGHTQDALDDQIGLVRYTPNGKVDSTFGLYGIATYIIGTNGKETNDMFILPDDRIMVGFVYTNALSGNREMAAMRLLSDGEIDSTFNQTGIASYGEGWLTYCNAMNVQQDGKILLAGYADSALVVRFDTTGVLDPTFGNGGICKLPPAAIRDMTLAPDGKILLTGTKDSSFVVYRCLPNGLIDTTFGNQGMILTKIEPGEEDRARCIALQQDGKILVGGNSKTQFPNEPYPDIEFVLARYLPDGHTGTSAIPGDKGSLLVYPNPVKNDKLLICWQGNQQPGLVNISLYDIAGRRLWYQENRTISNQPFNIDVSTFAAGVYLIKVSDNKGLNEERKFAKE